MWKQKISSICPSTWSTSAWSTSYNDDYKLVELTHRTSEFNKIKQEIGSYFTINKIIRVENKYLYGRYTLKLLECMSRSGSTVSEMQLIHCTNESNAEQIAAGNFDWRLAHRCKFGQGVSFSPSADYANTYSGNNGAFIVAKVIVGYSSSGSYTTKLPASELYDTTTGNGSKVYVKYYDDEFYPEYIVHYDDPLQSINRRFRRFRF